MKSRVSCCNAALLRRNLTRAALIWAAYLLIWMVALPANLISRGAWMDAMDRRELVLQAATICHMVSFLYGVVVAWFLFSYLNKSRSANFFGALPLRRETQFLTNYLSGLLCSLAPNFLLMGMTILAGFSRGANVITEAAIWFAAQSMTYLFYYSFAVLCAMVVGQIVAMPLLYGVLNFTAVVVETVIRELASALVYGLRSTSDYLFSWLSPVFYFVGEDNGPRYEAVWEEGHITALRFHGWGGLLIVAGVGVVFAAMAFWCYQRRRMEAAGDVMAVRHLKPVFRWCFTIGSTLVIGMLLAVMLVDELTTAYFYPIAACLAAATVVGYFLSEMILNKSLRVFRKRNIVNCAVSCAVVAALLVCCRLDVLGVARYVPELEEVQGVILDDGYRSVEDPVLLQEVLELHRDIIDCQRVTEKQSRQSYWSPSQTITYVRKDGTEVSRTYGLPVTEDTARDPNSLIRRYEEINNRPEAILAREVPRAFTAQDIDNCQIYYTVDEVYGAAQSIDPSAEEAIELWNNAILVDLRAGNMGRRYYTSYYLENEESYTDVSVEIVLRDGMNRETERNYYYYSIPVTAVNTIRALRALGVPEAAFETETDWEKR